MKSIRIYLVIIGLLLLVAIASSLYVWAKLQKLQTGTLPSTQSSVNVESGDSSTPTPKSPTSVSNTEVTEPIVVNPATLTDGQKKSLDLVGFDTEQDIIITPAMIDCGEKKLGKARLAEIVAGDTPSLIESAKLAGCI